MKVDLKHCSGCTACKEICPVNAIEMRADEHGFVYPVTDETLCIHCGKCEQVCACIKTNYTDNTNFKTFAYIHRDKNVLRNSSSGGLFTGITDVVLECRGVIYGAVLDEELRVHYKRADNSQQRDAMRGSKYVQSYLDDTFRSIKEDLKNEKIVFFIGTPCQVNGLKNFIKCDNHIINTEKLITCDLICNGVPSPLIWKEHVKLLEKKYGRKVQGYSFRPKKWGWNVHREIAYLGDDKKEVFSTFWTDLYRNLYYSRLVMRESCYSCPYSTMNRQGDITIGDCRHIEQLYPNMETYDGVSLAILNTEKGKRFFLEAAQKADIYPVNINKIMQPTLVAPGEKPNNSDQFWRNYRKGGYEYAVKQYYGKYCTEKYLIKKILHKN